jgi:hypothetical protein
MVMIIELLRWWYGPGWLRAVSRIHTRTAKVAHAFSAGTLLTTLFAPWKRIQYSGRSFDAKMQAIADNFVSRMIGFTVRLFVLIGAGILMFGSLVMGIAVVLVWPLIPLSVLVFVFKGVVG